MKKILGIFLLGAALSTNAFSAGMAVFDASNWLTALDTFYTSYDTVMNTVTQIENQYKQIQQAAARAKDIDWDNIQFEGGLDIRDDIKKVNRRVNRALTQANRIKDALTQDTIQVGDNRYSVADLCGQGEEGKNLAVIGGEYIGYLSANAKSELDKMEKGLTTNQREAIWQKYGIHPRNYLLVNQSKEFLKKQAAECIQKVQGAVADLEKTEEEDEDNSFNEIVTSNTDENGNVTEGAHNQFIRTLLSRLKEKFAEFSDDFNKGISMYCTKTMAEDREKELKTEAEAKAAMTNSYKEAKTGANFKKN